MKISLLPFLPKHLPEVSTLIQRSLCVLSAADYTPDQLAVLVKRENAAQHLQENSFAIVAVQENQIVGMAALQKTVGWAVINAVYVHPEFARQGIGTQLVRALEEEALQQRYRGIHVIASLTGVHLYKSLGYKIVAAQNLMDAGVPIPTVFMSKQLRPATVWENLISVLFISIFAALLFLVIVAIIASLVAMF